MITYHSGMRCYQHSRHVVTSNEDNCIGGFYFTDGTPLINIMKNYHLYVFTQDACPPCIRLKTL